MLLAERLAGLQYSILPCWVYDHEMLAFRWANSAALQLWQAATLEDFLARDVSKPSASTRTRLDNYMTGLLAGKQVSEDWTLYPHGKPTTMVLHGSGITLDDGRLAILFQATLKETPIEPSMIRATEALRHTSLIVSVHDEAGAVLFHNPAALRTFGDATHIHAWFSDGAQALLTTIQRGEIFQRECLVNTVEGPRWHSLRATPITDPVSGARSSLLQQLDIHQRRSVEDTAEARARLIDELSHNVALVEQQRQEILRLSAPILDVGWQTAAVPLIGELTPERLAEISPRLLETIQSQRKRRVILDLTGCSDVDAVGARGLVRLTQAIALLGAQSILTGIGPILAQAMITNHSDALGLLTRRSLRDGIDYSQKQALAESSGAPQRPSPRLGTASRSS
ncbi:MAG TPA: STAS domain-containing protein [Pseudomonadota bacterium]|nr:STAS domain-containing protein [Pseudomonadota bacterium]